MHKIGFIDIVGLRACQHVSLPVESFTPLVGQNNAGKSTILFALAWVLKPSALTESDFSKTDQPVVVTARIDGITDEILELIPEPKHRAAIAPYCASGSIWIRVVANEPGTKKVACEVFDFETYQGNDLPLAWRPYPTGLPQAVSALLPDALCIDAMEDLGEDLGKAKAGSTMKSLLDLIMNPIVEAHADLTAAMQTVRSILSVGGESRSGLLKAFDEGATEALGNFFPGLTIELGLQTIEIKEFFKAGSLNITDMSTGDRRTFDQLGTGAQRAIQMALIRHLADLRIGEKPGAARRLLLIDEPELYLHPQGVRRLRQALAALSQRGFQVVYATHSPLMLSRENAADAVIVHKDTAEGTLARVPLRHAVTAALEEAQAQSRTLFELGNLAEIYFSDLVVLCEGKTERRLLPLLYERLRGRHPELDQIAFVAVGACSDIPKALPVLAAMGIRACAIADLDFAFTEARKGQKSMLPKDDATLVRSKAALQRLQAQHGFPLGGNGLPTKDKTGWQAADTWAIFAADPEGAEISTNLHDTLRARNLWLWKVGCIENVTNHLEKGEEAILAQELAIESMDAQALEAAMPEIGRCFDWLDGLHGSPASERSVV
ncbi:AAA family ATPase [Paralcaligenes sp. KSB-10]|uniref:ATP-dependent nuclease n=1 Tax=Paralcaligenes sp. KSB-10 TaxID=2901142 RepID=UPI001E2E4D67|nr:AAA family ATPase [Paralcaligenes sp. KSB-10]UHL63511.1 AAA family ATPase [Paralcaligenes sp. KSB-10]